jgi:hypothetical protein
MRSRRAHHRLVDHRAGRRATAAEEVDELLGALAGRPLIRVVEGAHRGRPYSQGRAGLRGASRCLAVRSRGAKRAHAPSLPTQRSHVGIGQDRAVSLSRQSPGSWLPTPALCVDLPRRTPAPSGTQRPRATRVRVPLGGACRRHTEVARDREQRNWNRRARCQAPLLVASRHVASTSAPIRRQQQRAGGSGCSPYRAGSLCPCPVTTKTVCSVAGAGESCTHEEGDCLPPGPAGGST